MRDEDHFLKMLDEMVIHQQNNYSNLLEIGFLI